MSTGELPFRDVYEWANILTAEQRKISPAEYQGSQEAGGLIRRLKATKGQLVSVIGNQGTGKTCLRDALFLALKGDKVLSLKWMGKEPVVAAFDKSQLKDGEIYGEMILEEFVGTLGGGSPKDIAERAVDALGFKKGTDERTDYLYAFWGYTGDEYQSEADKVYDIIPLIEKKLERKRLGEIRREYLDQELRQADHILIDFPDYDKRARGQMLRDLRAFQEWWESIVAGEGREQHVSVVIFFQKELWGGHFHFGKFHVVELKPFPASNLAQYYERRFGSYAPFTVESLELLARLGRGVFRWFKKYVAICLERYYDLLEDGEAPSEIGVQQVNEWISLEVLVGDWERELIDLFPHSRELRKTSVKLLRSVAERGMIPQPQLVDEFFDGADMTCSRVLRALEDAGYIVRGYDGQQKIARIARQMKHVL